MAIVANAYGVIVSTPGLGQESVLTMPKNRSSMRRITLSPQTLAAFKTLRKQQNERALTGEAPSMVDRRSRICEPVFVDEVGRTVTAGTLRALLNRTGKTAGIGNVNPHRLRHSYASRLIARGIDVATVSRALGHSSVAVTMQVYSHGFESQVVHADALLAELSEATS